MRRLKGWLAYTVPAYSATVYEAGHAAPEKTICVIVVVERLVSVVVAVDDTDTTAVVVASKLLELAELVCGGLEVGYGNGVSVVAVAAVLSAVDDGAVTAVVGTNPPGKHRGSRPRMRSPSSKLSYPNGEIVRVGARQLLGGVKAVVNGIVTDSVSTTTEVDVISLVTVATAVDIVVAAIVHGVAGRIGQG